MKRIFSFWCFLLVLSQKEKITAATESTSETSPSTAAAGGATSAGSTTTAGGSTAAGTTEASTITTTTPTTTIEATTGPLPPSPTDVFVESLNSTSLRVSWNMNSTDNATANYMYNVTVNNGIAGCHTNETMCDVIVSCGGQNYSIEVIACIDGHPPCSSPAEGHNYTYPSVPGQLAFVAPATNSVSVKWDQPGGFSNFVITVDYHGHPNITDQIYCNNSKNTESDCTTVAISCNINGLEIAGGLYNVTVHAVVDGLVGVPQHGTFQTAPAQPGEIVATNRNTSSICVTWNQSGVVDKFYWNVGNNTNMSGTILSNKNDSKCYDYYPCSPWPVPLCVYDLEIAGGLYVIEIHAETGILNSSVQHGSLVTAPYAPQSVMCTSKTNSTVEVSVESPTSGKYDDDYLLMYYSQVNSVTSNGSVLTNGTNGNITVTNVTNLTAGVMYTMEARARSYDVAGDPVATNCTTIPNQPNGFSSKPVSFSSVELSWVPPAGYFEHYVIVYNNGSMDSITDTAGSDEINKTLSFLSSDSNYTFTLCTSSFNEKSDNRTTSNWTLPDKVTNLDVNPLKLSADVTWNAPYRHDNVGMYELTLLDHNRGCISITNFICTNKIPVPFPPVNSSCSAANESMQCSGTMKYTYKSLTETDNGYIVSISALNPGGKSLSLEAPFVPHPDQTGMIVGIVLGVFFGILLVILILFLIHRYRQDKPPFRVKRPITPDGRENPTYEDEVEPDPVGVDHFVNYVIKMGSDSNYLFASEYMMLGRVSPRKSSAAAETPENQTKNRYTDVLPFDESRVKLIPTEIASEDEPSDYINASYLPGVDGTPRVYIAAQGPMKSTVDSFWSMLWQQEVTVIVMVTNLNERGREKCAQYWPEQKSEPCCYGDISVQIKSESTIDFYAIRVMEVTDGSQKRQLTQYHFLTWPDFGIPEDCDHILTFVQEIRNNYRGSAPMVVHCSAGVGRTGTFIVVDQLLQQIKRANEIDLFHYVLQLRNHRPKMIQAESQYIFAHECIKMAIEKGWHRPTSSLIYANDSVNGDALYANASEMGNIPLYANASEFRDQPV